MFFRCNFCRLAVCRRIFLNEKIPPCCELNTTHLAYDTNILPLHQLDIHVRVKGVKYFTQQRMFNHSSIANEFCHFLKKLNDNAGADPGFDRGGAQIVTGLNCQWCAAASCERSEPFSAWGPGPTLGPQKLLGISLLNMHSLHFGVPFLLFLK